jgi:hypothetical protein
MQHCVPRCQAIKKNGNEMCSREAMTGSIYCKQHTNVYLKSMNMPPIIKSKKGSKTKKKKSFQIPFQGQQLPFQGQQLPFQGQQLPFQGNIMTLPNPNNPFDPLVCMNKSQYNIHHNMPVVNNVPVVNNREYNKEYTKEYCNESDINKYTDSEQIKMKKSLAEFIFSKNQSVSISELVKHNTLIGLCSLANILAMP